MLLKRYPEIASSIKTARPLEEKAFTGVSECSSGFEISCSFPETRSA